MAPFFPAFQHINIPSPYKSDRVLTELEWTPLVDSNDVALSPLSVRSPLKQWYTQYDDGCPASDSHEQRSCATNAILLNYDSAMEVRECVSDNLDIRGLWISYMSDKYLTSVVSRSGRSKLIDVSVDIDMECEHSVHTSGGDVSNLSVNSFLKDLNTMAILKTQDIKSVQFDAAKTKANAPTLSDSGMPSPSKDCLAAAQVCDAIYPCTLPHRVLCRWN